jgi:putative CRISPR-associated protein (TIGR02619 family)
MNILFVTVGTTALYNPDVGRAPDGTRDNRALRADVERYRNVSDKRPERWADLKTRLVEAHRQYWTVANANYWKDQKRFRETSAELTSSHFLIASLNLKFEKTVLLVSDTDDGRMAGDINRRVMEESLGWRGVSIQDVRTLDKDFVDPAPALRAALAESRLAKEDRVAFNMTGGFKGTVITLALLAAEENWEIYYQHESLAGVSCLTPPRADEGTVARLSGRIVRCYSWPK